MRLPSFFLVAFLVALSGCAQVARHQQGGASVFSLPALVSSGQGQAPVLQHMQQPENPIGPSVQTYERVIQTVAPDGTMTTETTKAGTSINGSQDLSRIIKAAYDSKKAHGALLALLLCGIAYLVRKEWPGAAIGLLVAAFFSAMVAWWAGLVALGGFLLLVYGWTAAEAAFLGRLKP